MVVLQNCKKLKIDQTCEETEPVAVKIFKRHLVMILILTSLTVTRRHKNVSETKDILAIIEMIKGN